MQALRTAFIISPNMARRIISMAKRLGEIAEQLDGVAPRKRRRRTPKPKATASAIREAHAALTKPAEGPKPKRSLATVPD